MDVIEGYDTTFKTVYDGQTVFIILTEITLVLGVIWLIFKKNNAYPNLNLTKSEEEELIKTYRPESLVEEDPGNVPLNPRVIKGKAGMYINVAGFKCINFGTHNFLGFVDNVEIAEKVKDCINIYGVGSCGPRGFYGTSIDHLELEKLLAGFLDGEDAILYSYGFATIASAIPAYAKKTDIIFVDEKRNFAIQQGLIASKSEIQYFKHNDTKDLEVVLENQRKKDCLNMRKAQKSRRYLVIEGIYINTGEICPLPDIVKLCKKYKVRIFIDESVSFAILGSTGKGVTEYFGIPRADVDLIMGSLEYSLASVGGFCVGPRILIDHQQISGQGYCFSASLPPLLVTAAKEALLTIQTHPEKLVKLNEICKVMHYKLNLSSVINTYFVVTGDQDSPIHILMLKQNTEHGQEKTTVTDNIVEFCLFRSIAITRASCLPDIDKTMAPASLRITTCIFHTQEHIIYLVQVLEEACKSVFLNYYKDSK